MKMNNSAFVVIMLSGMLVLGCLSFIPTAMAQDSSSDRVPAPSVYESHVYNQQETYNGQARENFDNEKWQVTIDQGNVKTLIMARNYSNNNGDVTVDYSQNINFYIGQKFYIAMFNIHGVTFKFKNENISAQLKYCHDFQVMHTPIVYDDAIPTLYCNISYNKVRLYPDQQGDSYFDLMLVHYIRGDWNKTSIKVEAHIDLTHAEFYGHSAGEAFGVEVRYVMQLTDPEMMGDNTIKPSGFSDMMLSYDLNQSNGSPYTLSRLDMNDNFSMMNGSGTHQMMGYSSMYMASQNANGMMMYNSKAAMVNHGFPNLTYKQTSVIKSDPEITVYHDRVYNDSALIMIIVVATVAAVTIGGVVLVVRKRRRLKI